MTNGWYWDPCQPRLPSHKEALKKKGGNNLYATDSHGNKVQVVGRGKGVAVELECVFGGVVTTLRVHGLQDDGVTLDNRYSVPVPHELALWSQEALTYMMDSVAEIIFKAVIPIKATLYEVQRIVFLVDYIRDQQVTYERSAYVDPR